MSPGLLRLTPSGPAIVVLSINRCRPVTQCCEAPSSFISFVYAFLSFACRFFSHLLFSGLGLSVSRQAPVGWCLLFVALLRNNMQTHIENTTNKLQTNYEQPSIKLRRNFEKHMQIIRAPYEQTTNHPRTTYEKTTNTQRTILRTNSEQTTKKHRTNHE